MLEYADRLTWREALTGIALLLTGLLFETGLVVAVVLLVRAILS